MIIPKEGEKKSSSLIPEHATIYRIGDPLAQYILDKTKECDTPLKEVIFDYSATPTKVSFLEPYIGNSGWLQVNKLTVESFEHEDYLLIACLAEDGTVIEPDVAERLFSLSAQVCAEVSIPNKLVPLAFSKSVINNKPSLRKMLH